MDSFSFVLSQLVRYRATKRTRHPRYTVEVCPIQTWYKVVEWPQSIFETHQGYFPKLNRIQDSSFVVSHICSSFTRPMHHGGLPLLRNASCLVLPRGKKLAP